MAQLVMKRPEKSTPLTENQGTSQRGSPADDRAAALSCRTATAADAEALAKLLKSAFPEMEWDAARARRDLLDADDVRRTFVVEQHGELLGTASARYFEKRFPGVGYVHWVAVDPAARGRGIFDAVMAAVHRQFLEDGRSIAFLETDDHRLPAIAAYLRLGYVPQYTETDHEGRWSAIFTTLAEGRRGKR
jgi:GNAT superfamily N-acetyltransferase